MKQQCYSTRLIQTLERAQTRTSIHYTVGDHVIITQPLRISHRTNQYWIESWQPGLNVPLYDNDRRPVGYGKIKKLRSVLKEHNSDFNDFVLVTDVLRPDGEFVSLWVRFNQQCDRDFVRLIL